MRIPVKSLLALGVGALLALFVWQNETAFFGLPGDPPPSLRFLGARFQAPLGLVLLAFIGLLCLLFLVYALSLHAQSLLEVRRMVKASEAARRLAESAELSRIGDLRNEVSARFAELTKEVQEVHNSLSAILAEMEDRLLPPAASRPEEPPPA